MSFTGTLPLSSAELVLEFSYSCSLISDFFSVFKISVINSISSIKLLPSLSFSDLREVGAAGAVLWDANTQQLCIGVHWRKNSPSCIKNFPIFKMSKYEKYILRVIHM